MWRRSDPSPSNPYSRLESPPAATTAAVPVLLPSSSSAGDSTMQEGSSGVAAGVSSTERDLNEEAFSAVASPGPVGAARMMQRASSRRFMRQESVLVRDAAAEQLQERLNFRHWVVMLVLLLLFHMSMISAIVVVLILTVKEKPAVPIRIWLIGQAVIHITAIGSSLVQFHEERRNGFRRPLSGQEGSNSSDGGGVSQEQVRSRSDGAGAQFGYVSEGDLETGSTSTAGAARMPPASAADAPGKLDAPAVLSTGAGGPAMAGEPRGMQTRLDSPPSGTRSSRGCLGLMDFVVSVFPTVWWIVGISWLVLDVNSFDQAPVISWFTLGLLMWRLLAVLAMTILTILLSCALCCCLPCIIALLTLLSSSESGASEDDIRKLPEYRFSVKQETDAATGSTRTRNVLERVPTGAPASPSSPSLSPSSSSPTTAAATEADHPLDDDDNECCICLMTYEEGALLRKLPCRHHFHTSCIDRWLKTKPTCPLCKSNITKSGTGESPGNV
eukprot:TRINITY_DN1255_c0_g1_i1.p1 TRINITY_DN1255_c0_g1~~TRINITY_DN1255_c0_g1_i1.p1  ORF type:complete len:500 (-),score=110.97 TRINITY_DN1255_c0_g1_i1:180-1679(-)